MAVVDAAPRTVIVENSRRLRSSGRVLEGFDTAQREVYVGVRRGRAPSAAYNAKALGIAERAVVLGGYRLAALMNALFG